jgi:type II secretory pathway pseudopilin PulG
VRWTGQSAHREACRGTGGYTLLEVTVSLAIAVTLLALALPSLRHLLAERKVVHTAAEVQRALRSAQQTASAQAGRLHRVEARFQAGDQPWVELWGVPWESAIPTLLWSRPVGPSGVQVRKGGSSAFTVGFAASGALLAGHQGTLEVRSAEAVRYVVVSPVTGRVRVSSEPP